MSQTKKTAVQHNSEYRYSYEYGKRYPLRNVPYLLVRVLVVVRYTATSLGLTRLDRTGRMQYAPVERVNANRKTSMVKGTRSEVGLLAIPNTPPAIRAPNTRL